jgi:hypothetical protein
MTKVLERPVTVTHPKSGERHRFDAGDELPAWAAKIATNPRLFQPSSEVVKERKKAEEAEATKYGSGPFEDRDRKQLLALAQRYADRVGEDSFTVSSNKGELVALLQAAGIDEDADEPED